MNNTITVKELLVYGDYLVDESFTLEGVHNAIRIRIIKVDDSLYYHKMVAGKVVDVKFLGCVKENKNVY